jgi:hypothetical protein
VSREHEQAVDERRRELRGLAVGPRRTIAPGELLAMGYSVRESRSGDGHEVVFRGRIKAVRLASKDAAWAEASRLQLGPEDDDVHDYIERTEHQ